MRLPLQLLLRSGVVVAALTCGLVAPVLGVSPPEAGAEPRDLQEEIAAYLQETEEARAVRGERLSQERSVSEVLEALQRRHMNRPERRRGLHKRSVDLGEVVADYVVVAPRAYDPRKRWPVHISLHGGGKSSRYNERTCWDHDWGRRPQRDLLLVCPTTPTGKWWLPLGDATVMAVYRAVLKEWSVDLDRVSIGGMSNGGTGSWHMAMKYPWLWSGVVPRCAGEIRDDGFVENIARLPTYMIHGTRDSLIPVASSRAMLERLSRVGNQARLKEITSGGHRFFSRENPRVLAWLQARQRSLPHSFTYTSLPDSDKNPPGLVYWIHAPGAERIEAHLVREPTGIRVNLAGKGFPEPTTVYIPESFVSPRATLRVFQGDAQVHVGPMTPSVQSVLQSYRLSGDPGRTYTVGVTLDLPKELTEAQSVPESRGSEAQRKP